MTFYMLTEYWRIEVAKKKRVGSHIGLITSIIRQTRKDNKLRFVFHFRLAQFMHSKGGFWAAHARRIQQKLNLRYAVDIDIGATIGLGFRIAHLPGIVISGHAVIGRNFFIRQNTTIGIKTLGLDTYNLKIGDNVSVGANSCIIADDIYVGDNVTVGAMSLVTKGIPANSVFYNKRLSSITPTFQE
ncbi:serine acetyltransferase [Pseudomonas congelans]|uniref:serine acetyltransferase n=1 Tax=Pseudomonas congelans TaxID=200452 RepID=UPI001BDC2028|nr:serine acetyltransferase [Pseudomonas congelans]QVX15024.1 serine acetyltransferase [Pseudomonas congelans]